MKTIFIACLCLFFVGCKSNKNNIAEQEKDNTEQKFDSVITQNIETIKHAKDSVIVDVKEKMGNWNISGTEPFWNIQIKNDVFLFTKLNDKIDSVYFKINDFSFDNKFIKINVEDKTKRKSELVLKENKCSDGMSDKQFQYSAVFTYNNVLFNGCAEKK